MECHDLLLFHAGSGWICTELFKQLGGEGISSNEYTYAKDKYREVMEARGAEKTAGCSWIEIGTSMHSFLASDELHPHIFQRLSPNERNL